MLSPISEPDSLLCGHLSYVVGRDEDGRWLAVEEHGLGGGLFATCEAAVRYASFESGRPREAVPISAEPVRLRL